jgi:acetyl-CoA carboxylase biotin carboxyl carrier protein
LAHENLTYEDLLQIVELIKSSEQFSEFRLKIGDIEIELKRRGRDGATPASLPASDTKQTVCDVDRVAPVNAGLTPADGTGGTTTAAGTPQSTSDAGIDDDAQPSARSGEPPWPSHFVAVRAPMMGTFYRSPAPGAPPFISVGQPVEADTTVCIIEVMKLMNSIAAGVQGVVTHVLVDDGYPVNAGAPLVVLDPRGAPR